MRSLSRYPGFTSLRHRAAIALFLVATAMWFMAGRESRQQQVRLPLFQLGGEAAELRIAEIAWLEDLLAGEEYAVGLALLPEDGAASGSPAVLIPDLGGGRAQIEARLDLPGLELQPEGVSLGLLQPGVPLRFTWLVRPAAEGEVAGTLWVHLTWQDADGSTRREPLLAREIRLRADAILGITANQARWASGAGWVLALLLLLRDFERGIWHLAER